MKRFLSVVKLCALSALGVAAVLTVTLAADHRPPHGTFDLVEATIPSIQNAIDRDIISARQLVAMYLRRIAAYDGKTTATRLNSYIFVNPHALEDASQGDDDNDHGHRQPL